MMVENKSTRDHLDEVALELKSKYGIKVFFCEIIGSRWSFFAGDKTLDIPQYQVMLNDGLGMMAGEISCTDDEWSSIVKTIKQDLTV